MKKILFLLSFLLVTLFSVAQSSVSFKRIVDNTTLASRNTPVNTLILDIDSSKIYRLTSTWLAGTAFNTASKEEVSGNQAIQVEVDQQATTGVLTGGEISINGVDNTKIDIADGSGLIVDSYTNPLAPVKTLVTWSGQTSITVTNLATESFTDFRIDNTGTVLQKNDRNNLDDYRDALVIGRASHPAGTQVDLVVSEVNVAFDRHFTSFEWRQIFGTINISGNVYGANGANLNIDRSAGEAYRTGVNYINSKKNPNKALSAPDAALSFFRVYDDGTGSDLTVDPITNLVNPNIYDDGTGTPAAVPNNKWSIRFVYFFPGSQSTIIRLGTGIHDSKDLALASAESELPFVSETIMKDANLRCFLAVQEGATDLSDENQAGFREAAFYGGGSGDGVVTTLQGAYDNSSQPQITTSTALGSLQIKRGSAADTDIIFEVLNGADASVFSVTGEGDVTLDGDLIGGNFIGKGTTAERNLETPSVGDSWLNTERHVVETWDGDLWLNPDAKKLRNQTGGAVLVGQPMELDGTVDGSGVADVVYAGFAQNDFYGVVIDGGGTYNDGDYVLVAYKGTYPVYSTFSVTSGEFIRSIGSGDTDSLSSINIGTFAIAVEDNAVTGGDVTLCTFIGAVRF